MKGLTRLLCTVAAGSTLGIPGLSYADWPADKPIAIVVPYPPGGVTDQLARLLAKEMTTGLGQSVIVQNRAGAGGLLGARIASQAAPDGYTLLLSQIASHGTLPALHKNPGYDPNRSFAPVALVAAHPLVLAANPKLAVKNAGDLLARAQAKPGDLNYASAGVGTTFFLSAELLKSLGNVFITGIHYQGGSPAVLSTLAGETDIVFSDFATAMPHVKSGALRGLGVTERRQRD